jgi:glutathione S-transferase
MQSMSLTLYIGNKNYSSWSMRPWVLLTQAGIPFKEEMVRFDSFNQNSQFKKAINTVSPTGKVPLLMDGDLAIWDTLAISEYLAEKFPEKNLWPKDARARSVARSVCAEMHSSFTGLRTHCGMNIEANLCAAGALAMRDKPQVAADLARIVQMWTLLLSTYKGPMLFGEFSIADAYYAPVCMRIVGYGLPVPDVISEYVARVKALTSVSRWMADAVAEKDFLDFEEPHRLSRL